jgi:hypothetical protein
VPEFGDTMMCGQPPPDQQEPFFAPAERELLPALRWL